MDETYVNHRGQWHCLHRAIDGLCHPKGSLTKAAHYRCNPLILVRRWF